jgi:diguanylate cyclase (GGDEF)-like protein
MLDTLEHLFGFYEFEVLRAENGKEGLEIAEREQPGIVLLDALMPVMDGFEACEKLKKNPKTRDIPVIFLSANYTDREHRLKGMELGADDYLLKPFNAKELILKINSLLHRKQLIDKLRDDNQLLLKKQRQTPHSAEDFAHKAPEFENHQTTDPLTGLYNENYFNRRLDWEFQKSLAAPDDLALIVLDVDFFNKINQAYGEKTGDYVLMRIANVILHNTRNSDIVFRLKKNKFIVVLPQTSEKSAFYEAERIRAAILQTQFLDQDFVQLIRLSPKRKQTIQNITVSIGIVTRQGAMDKEDFLKNAENSLAKAKANGRNTTVRYSQLDN